MVVKYSQIWSHEEEAEMTSCDVLLFSHPSSTQHPRSPNSSSSILPSSSSSPSVITSFHQHPSLSVTVPRRPMPPLQREEVGAGRHVLSVPLHHQSWELQPEKPDAQPSPLQVSPHADTGALEEMESDEDTFLMRQRIKKHFFLPWVCWITHSRSKGHVLIHNYSGRLRLLRQNVSKPLQRFSSNLGLQKDKQEYVVENMDR